VPEKTIAPLYKETAWVSAGLKLKASSKCVTYSKTVDEVGLEPPPTGDITPESFLFYGAANELKIPLGVPYLEAVFWIRNG